MAEQSWTAAQRAAIEAGRGDLLICAAAGSGKTAVLTRRVIRYLTAEQPVDITRMLIVTFTNASAAELKSKISRAITEQMGREQGNLRLQKQLLALDRAQICTIDSFCIRLITAHFSELGLPAVPRIGDEAELSILRDQVMEELLDRLYEEGAPDFLRLVRSNTDLRDDRLAELLLGVYEKISSYPEGVEYVRMAAERLNQAAERGIPDSPYGRQADQTLRALLAHYRAVYVDLLAALPGSDPQKCVDVFLRDLAWMERLLACPDPAERAGSVSEAQIEALVRNTHKSEEYERLQAVRSDYTDDLKRMRERFFTQSPADQKIAAARSADLCAALYRLLNRFQENYTAEKRRQGILDYADVERYARLLLIRDGQPTATAKEVAGHYDQIYIDEYQDSNRIQDDIFRAISRKNRFLVGDIKQSIYSFRGAVPDVFAEYRAAFPDYDPDAPTDGSQPGGKIFLSHNFRSTKPILDFVNALFDRLLTLPGGRVPYDCQSDGLHFPEGKDPSGKPVRLALIQKSDGEDDSEAEWVADRIAEQIAAGRSPGEIAILLRSPKNAGKPFEEALRRRGIRTESMVDENFFNRPEILLMLSLLGAIDNPRRDIELAGAMKSPVFGITLEELILLRRAHEGECLYDSLKSAAKSGDFPRSAAFLDWLERMREEALQIPCDRLIREIYRDTSLIALVSADPECGREGADRLRRFYAFAHAFESRSFRGLHSFVRYLDDVRAGSLTPSVEKPGSDGNCVKILSVHRSKGLEFPVVYFCRTDRSVNLRDQSQPLLIQRELGIAMMLRDESGMAKCDSTVRQALSSRIRENLIEEEIRTLYVALTRPKEELTVTGQIDRDQAKEAIGQGRYLDRYLLSKRPCYLRWILAALGEGSPACELLYVNRPSAAPDSVADRSPLPDAPSADFASADSVSADSVSAEPAPAAPERDEPSPDSPISPDSPADPDGERVDLEALAARLNYVYPHEAEISIPSKAVVSALYPSYLDESEPVETHGRFHARPAFLDPSPAPTGAERGTATHLFMQFCDFESVRRSGVQAELARLTDRGFITRSQAAIVYADRLETFFRSPLFAQMAASPELHREYRFLLSKPAGQFTENPALAAQISDAKMLVQGVIDCFFRLPDGSYKLVDYKTDRIFGKSDPQSAARGLIEEYGDQLRYYREAIEQLGGVRVSRTVIYAFDLGLEIEIPEKGFEN